MLFESLQKQDIPKQYHYLLIKKIQNKVLLYLIFQHFILNIIL
ncbi:hypothetical protein DFP79_1516 [Marinomonas balearica]|uniref:Uncharacterized protein n=1 Tax=Marinomonas balearica TaxID=491947 RepID=A0A4R6MEF5_9GAMM|nr:hypothetical protein DFP79_1516 [Marinomonas balearica]